jgi:hypothetical protein
MLPQILASTGIPGRIGTVHIDTIVSVRSARTFDRTSTAIELGAPITSHRQRNPYPLIVEVLVSDVAPLPAPPPLWEFNHAAKTRDRVYALQDRGTRVPFFDGRRLYTTPSGIVCWVIDTIDDGIVPGEEGVWRATITLGEQAEFGTLFTPVTPDVSPDIEGAVDGVADKGAQSLEIIPQPIGATIPG